MSASLLRSDEIPDDGGRLVISGPEGKHGAAALRLKPGEGILVGDGAGVLAECEVVSAAGSEVEVVVRSRTEHQAPRPSVTIVQALPKIRAVRARGRPRHRGGCGRDHPVAGRPMHLPLDRGQRQGR